MKKTGFYGYVYDFSVDYDAIAVHDILDIPKCLMKKNNIVQIKCLGLLKKMFVVAMTLFGCNMLKCVSMNNQECKIGPERTFILSLQYRSK